MDYHLNTVLHLVIKCKGSTGTS